MLNHDGTRSSVRVLLLAYAFSPTEGSESGTGWSMYSSARAAGHTVTVITQTDPALLTDLGSSSDEHDVRQVGPELNPKLRSYGLARRLHSLVWHFWAYRKIRTLCRNVQYDLCHHVTYSADWAPTAGAFRTGLPLVWGPVGGFAPLNPGLFRWLGLKGSLAELVRSSVTGLARRTVGNAIHDRAATVVYQNADVERAFSKPMKRSHKHRVVAPNVCVSLAPSQDIRRRSKVVGFAGNLIRLKGVALLLEAMADHSLRQWQLEIVGDGPERGWLERRSEALGIGNQVDFLGRLPHTETLRWMQTVQTFAFPSFRDSAGWAVAEAVMVGTPVVVLDRVGPPTITSGHGVVDVRPLATLPSRFARAISDGGYIAPAIWTPERLTRCVDEWYSAALEEAGR